MKRNWDVIRAVLLKVESLGVDGKTVNIRDFPEELCNEYYYNMDLICQGPYVECIKEHVKGYRYYQIRSLTMDGHDLLDSIRSKNTWDEIKRVSKETGIELTLDSVKQLASTAVKSLISIAG